MTLVVFVIVALGIALVCWCVFGRATSWHAATQCRCGYDVESLVGAGTAGLDGRTICPECATRLTLRTVRVRGQRERRYPPKVVSLVLVGLTWMAAGMMPWVIGLRSMPAAYANAGSCTTRHWLGSTNEARIAWTWKIVTRDGAVIGGWINGAVTIGDRTFSVSLRDQDYAYAETWTRWIIKDSRGEQVIPESDLIAGLETHLAQAGGLRDTDDARTLVTVLREGVWGIARRGQPSLYAAASQTEQLVTRRTKEFRVTDLQVVAGFGLGFCWFFLFALLMRWLWRRPTKSITYAAQ
ncbi:MAG TPA: hypothetical protein VK157_12480 [Phycisphaerales bacterium]|nr:hypothetical protein [Phycisphaerales bacterium]